VAKRVVPNDERRPGEGRWWRAVAATAASALLVAVVIMVFAGHRISSTRPAALTELGLSDAARAVLASVVGDTSELDAYRGRVVEALERNRTVLPEGSADALLTNLKVLDGTIEQMVDELQRHPTDLRLIGLLLDAYRQQVDVLQRAGRLLEGSQTVATGSARDASPST